MAVQSESLQIFCSSAPEDEALCKQLHNHLRLLERERILTLWHQRFITAGTDWAKATDEQLTSASIILLLLSPAFFASDYCYGVEMRQAMQRHEAGTACVIPILLRPVDWTLAPFAHLSFLPSNRKSVAEWSNRDAAFTDIVMGLRHVIEELTSGSVGSVSRRTTPSVWNVPYRRNPHFTGRDDLLNQLQQQLSPKAQEPSTLMRRAALTQPQAIKGLGGIGKTQIAVEYAYRAQEQSHYTHTLWINAANEETLITSFAGLAELLPAFSSKGETDQGRLAAAIKRWLEQCSEHWLLIFDNADNVSLIHEYLPLKGNGSILLTTRASSVGSFASSIEVETMSFVEGTHLLLRRAQRFTQASDEEINEAGNIVIALDHFPLALDQAGAYIDEARCSLTDYLTLYQSHRKALLARRGKQTTNYPDSVATTWSLSFQKVEQASPAAAELLRLCAFLAPDHIPEELFREGAAYWPSPLQEAAADLFTFNQMLQALLDFSLVKRLAEEHLLSIHRLVQAIQLESMELEEQSQWAERVVRAVNVVFPLDPKNNIVAWPQCLRYLEQAQACHTLIQQHKLLLPEAADVLDRTATYLREHASYPVAEPLWELALQIREQHVATSLIGLAALYNYQGKYSQAEPLYQRALHIWEQSLGSEHPQVAAVLHGLAELYYDRSKYTEAEPFFLRALHIWEQSLGPKHTQVTYALNSLADLYREQGKYTEAEPLFLRALYIWEQSSEPEHPRVGYALNGLAELYREQGKYTEAKSLHQQALHIREQSLGPEHPHVGRSLNNLAIVYYNQGQYEEAKQLHQRALHVWEQSLGAEHPQVAAALTNLALDYYELGNYTEAEPLYQRALAICEQQAGPDHYDVARVAPNLAILYQTQGKYTEAESLYQRTIRIMEQSLGAEHPSLSFPLTNLAELYFEQGMYAKAETLYQRALTIREQQLGVEHPLVAYPLTGLADLYREQGIYTDAALFYQRALSIRERSFQTDHPDLSDTLHGFAVLHEIQGNLKDAVALYQRALSIREHTLGSQHPRTIRTYEHLRAVLVGLDQVEDVAQLDAAQQEPAETKREQETPPEP